MRRIIRNAKYKSLTHFYQLQDAFLKKLSPASSPALTIKTSVIIAILATVSYLTIFNQTLSPWAAVIAFTAITASSPVILLQIADQYLKGEKFTTTAKYITYIAIAGISWESSMEVRQDLLETFKIPPSQLPSAYGFGIFIYSAYAYNVLSMILCLMIQIATPLISAFSGETHNNYKYTKNIAIYGAPPRRNTSVRPLLLAALILTTFCWLLFINQSYINAFNPNTRKTIIARLAWEEDMLQALPNCKSGEKPLTGPQYRMLPITTPNSPNLVYESLADLPATHFWKMEKTTHDQLSSFNIYKAECQSQGTISNGLDSATHKKHEEEKYKKETSKYWGITPIAHIEISPATQLPVSSPSAPPDSH